MTPSDSTGAASGRIELGDIKAKLQEIDTEVREVADVEGPSVNTTMLLAVGGAVALVVVAFLLGRKRGRRKSTWVEIRRL